MSGFNGFLLVLLANAALRESILTRCSKAREVAPRPNTGLEPARGTIASAPRLSRTLGGQANPADEGIVDEL